MILVDSSVWIDHLRKSEAELSSLITIGLAACHPYVIGELAMGSVKDRGELFARLRDLPVVEIADDAEVLHLVEQRRLYGRGVGYVDAHLLASTLLTPAAKLWSRDRRLADAAQHLGIAHRRQYLQ